MINIRDIREDTLNDASDLATIAVPPGIDATRFRVQPGDVLLTARSILKIAPVTQDHAKAIAAANLIVVRPGKLLAAPLVLAFLRHPETRRKLEQLRTGTTVSSLNVGALSGLQIRIPPTDQQAKLMELAETSEQAYLALTRAAEMRRKIAQDVLVRSMEVQ